MWSAFDYVSLFAMERNTTLNATHALREFASYPFNSDIIYQVRCLDLMNFCLLSQPCVSGSKAWQASLWEVL
jgi:hypothetical protein